MPYPPRMTPLELSNVSATPVRGARRTALGSSSPRPQPASDDVTEEIGTSGNSACASALILPFLSLAITNRPPGDAKSIDDSLLFTSYMCWLYSYRRPRLTVR